MYAIPSHHRRAINCRVPPSFRTDISPTLYVYGYEIDQVKAVKYLVRKYPGWARTYNIFDNHFEAMDAIANEVSEESSLALHALPLWVGSHYTSFGIVFFEDTMAPGKRTPKDTEKLRKLEGLLESMAILGTEKATFGLLCSAACREYPVEPPELMRRPPPLDCARDRGHELMCLMDELDYHMPIEEPRTCCNLRDYTSGGILHSSEGVLQGRCDAIWAVGSIYVSSRTALAPTTRKLKIKDTESEAVVILKPLRWFDDASYMD